jgi:hypothetical protein
MSVEEPNITMRLSPVGIDGDADPFVRDATPIDLFDAWLWAEADATLTLEAWNSAATADKSWAHSAYRAALDREEHAARVLAARVRPMAQPVLRQRRGLRGVDGV